MTEIVNRGSGEFSDWLELYERGVLKIELTKAKQGKPQVQTIKVN